MQLDAFGLVVSWWTGCSKRGIISDVESGFMDPMMESLVSTLLSTSTTVRLRPRYEGSNICTWIGFKHVNYLVEEAVLEHFRAAGLSSRRLFEEFGLGLDLVDLDTQIRTAFHLDDVGVARVEPIDARGLSFTVSIDLEGRTPSRAVVAKVKVVLRRETYVDPTDNVPGELTPFTVDTIGEGPGIGAAVTTEGDPVLEQLLAGRNAFGWRQRIAYPYCHFNERLQMSGYLRQMEAAADLFLADRGISIRKMLDTRRWIPVVPHSRIRMLAEALMEEDLYTIYAVDEVFKDLTYRSAMDTYVVRDGRFVHTSTGTITHGYAMVQNRRDWTLVTMDEPVLDAIRGVRPNGIEVSPAQPELLSDGAANSA